MLAPYTTPDSGTSLASAGVPRGASSIPLDGNRFCLHTALTGSMRMEKTTLHRSTVADYETRVLAVVRLAMEQTQEELRVWAIGIGYAVS
jgi:hypothetical protein